MKVNAMGKDMCLQFCKAINTALVYGAVHGSFSLWNRSCAFGDTFEEILVLNDQIKLTANDAAANQLHLYTVELEVVHFLCLLENKTILLK